MKIALGILFSACALAQLFPVSGILVDATNGTPIRRARVTLTAQNGAVSAVVTGEDGKFSFQVPRGKYGFAAEYRGLRQPFGQSGPGIGFGVSLYTGPDHDTAHLVFQWFPAGAITGKIVDDRGEPAERVLVQLIRRTVVGGRKRLVFGASYYTNDLGEYRFAPVAGGTFYLFVTGQPWYSANQTGRLIAAAAAARNSSESAPEPSPAYAPAYYPNALDIGGASPLVLAPGAEVRADFVLRTINGVNVNVHLPGIPPGRAANLSLLSDVIEGVQGFQRQLTMNSESATITGVPPGHYVVRVAAAGENPFTTRKSIDVGSSDLTVELQMQAAPSVSGKMGNSKPSSPLSVRLVAEDTPTSYTQPVDAKGSFSFKNVAAGRYRPILVSAAGWFISQITAKGGPFENGVLTVADGASVELEIVAANEVGVVKGFVVNGETPLAGMLAVLAREGSKNPLEFHGFETDSDGSFEWANVPAGNYVLFAVNRLDFEYANPEAVEPYLASGKRITVAARSIVSERIAVSAAAAQ